MATTKKTVLIHISSERRMNCLFTLSGLCATAFKVGGLWRTCCGKVDTMKNGLHTIGCILDESEDGIDLTARLITNEVVILPKPNYNRQSGLYDCAIDQNVNEQVICEYVPIRIAFRTAGYL
eukprot:scaffold31964_cov35-Attheya_sp.AAC.2